MAPDIGQKFIHEKGWNRSKLLRDYSEFFMTLNCYENIYHTIFFSKLRHVRDLDDTT